MSGTATELVEKLKTYLHDQFPGQEISEELDASRDVVELRVHEPDGRTLLAEIPSKHLEGADGKEIVPLIGAMASRGRACESSCAFN